MRADYPIRVSGIGYRVSGIGYRVSGIGYRVSGIGYRRPADFIVTIAFIGPTPFCFCSVNTLNVSRAYFGRVSGQTPNYT